nr:hypothetical protein [Rhodococcus sp. (in: high G+C Gram-positive bacteria)]
MRALAAFEPWLREKWLKLMRSIVIPVVAFSALVALAGCSSDSGGDSSGANADACTQFAAIHNELTALTVAGPNGAADVEKWTSDKNAAIAKLSPLAEQATDSVKESIQTVVTALPADSLELTEPDSESGQAFVDNSSAVASSCDSDGTTITLADFPLQAF